MLAQMAQIAILIADKAKSEKDLERQAAVHEMKGIGLFLFHNSLSCLCVVSAGNPCCLLSKMRSDLPLKFSNVIYVVFYVFTSIHKQ